MKPTIFVVLSLLFVSCCSGQVASSIVPESGQEIPEDIRPVVSALQKAVDATIASKQGEQLGVALEGLRVSDPQSWFSAAFGSENGAKLAAMYPESAKKMESSEIEYFAAHGQPGGSVTARIASGGGVAQKSPFQQEFDAAIQHALTKPAVFYSLQYTWTTPKGESTYYPLGYATLMNGRYGLLSDGLLRTLPEMPAKRIRLGGKTAAGMLTQRVTPQYPDEAKRQRVSGVVRLHAVIARDGTIKTLEVVSGNPTLTQAALDAVRQWRYRPTMLNGESVEVDTVIDVEFAVRE